MNPKVKRILFYVIVAILVGVFLFSAYNLGKYLIESFTTDKLYGGYAGDKNQIIKDNNIERPVSTPATTPGVTQPGDTLPPVTQPPQPTYVTITHPKTGESMEILPEFADAFLSNSDLVGWICIPGTDIDYPVVQTPDRVDYYLHRDFNKKYNLHGCIYAREQCDINAPSDNITLYGHRMQDGSMFAQLINYNKKDFFEKNRYIYFDTLTERHNYEIIAVFKTTATLGEGFQYHQFVDAASEESFNSFVSTCKSKSFYDTGVTAQYGDKLICLSTCEYSQENGRLVIVAKRIA